MCGIAGIWHLNGENLSAAKLKSFTNSMSHRGPDGEGVYIDENVQLGLGHRRLSILDLSDAAAQPMHYSDNNLVICYNGEVFNFIELKKELEQLGFSFKTTSDTEVILAAYKKWGKDCLHKFNGMWAMAIWDKQKQRLFLARDRFGIKPLYYTYTSSNLFAFASETYAFKFLENYSRNVSANLLARTLNSPMFPEGTGYTIFENIVQLLPGHFMEFSKNEAPVQKRWWDTTKNIPKIPQRYEEQVEQFKEIFENACNIRMRSDVTLASALSGGMDSSSVYCMLHHLMKKNSNHGRVPENWQQAFVGTFPGTDMDEKLFAEEVIKHVNGNGVFIAQDFPQLAQRIIETTKLFDSITPTPIIAVSDIYKSMHNNGIKVSMDGHGVDEMLYGYTSLTSSVYTQALLNNDQSYAEDLLSTFSNMYPLEQRKQMKESLILQGKKKAEHFSQQQNSGLKKRLKSFAKLLINKNTAIKSLQTGEWLNNKLCGNIDSLTANPYNLAPLSYAELLLFEEFHLTTLPLNLRDFDRASMMNSIEIRMPFMDWRLVTFVFGLPLQSKIGNGFTKRILRDAMKGLMPESIRTRTTKIGLAAPTANWFIGPLKEFVLDTTSSASFVNSEHWNGKTINKYIEETYKSNSWDKINSARVWSFINAHLILN